MAWPLLEAEAAARGAKIVPVDSEHAALFQLISRIGKARDRPRGRARVVRIDDHGIGRSFPRQEPAELEARQARRGGLASELEHGAEDHDRLGHDGEQGTRGDRGLAALRLSRGSRTRAHTPPEHRARPGEDAGRQPLRPALVAGHAAADPKRPHLAGLPSHAHSAAWTSRASASSSASPKAERYPLLGLAYRALALGEGAAIAYNAADEVAVAAFEAGRVGFMDIARVVAQNSRKSLAFTRRRPGEYIRD